MVKKRKTAKVTKSPRKKCTKPTKSRTTKSQIPARNCQELTGTYEDWIAHIENGQSFELKPEEMESFVNLCKSYRNAENDICVGREDVWAEENIKLDYTLAPPEFDDVILVLQKSAESGKYGRDDWLNGIQFDKEASIASIKRHLSDYRKGKTYDTDGGLHNMLYVACRALMQYTLDCREYEENSK